MSIHKYQNRKSNKISQILTFFLKDLVIFFFFLVYFPVSQILAQQCFTRQEVSIDKRCLFIVNEKVYAKGTRDAPHQGHPCGTDVTSILPSFHTAAMEVYMTPNYLGDICAVQPTPTIDPLLDIPILNEIDTGKGDISSYEQQFALAYTSLISCFGVKFDTSECIDKKSGDINNDGLITQVDYNLILIGFNKINKQKIVQGIVKPTMSSDSKTKKEKGIVSQDSPIGEKKNTFSELLTKGVFASKYAAGGSLSTILLAFGVTGLMKFKSYKKKKEKHAH